MLSTPFHVYYTARILESLQDDDMFIPTFSSSDIKVYPYQVAAALFATRSPYSKGVILMGESGLGKSTEAMLVVTQKWYEGKNRILIAVPNADLLVQWEKMIENKYRIPFVKITSNQELENAGNTFEQEAVVLTTFEFASQCEKASKLIWDLTVFEEASLLSSVHKEDNKQARALKRIAEGSFKLLLTGTPIEKNILDLCGLMYFIDETIQNATPYYIFITCCDVPMMIGKTGQYVTKVKNAMSFTHKIDALEYVDKHGYNRISTVRQIKKSN